MGRSLMLALLASLCACSGEETPKQCPLRPAFDLALTAADGPLPADTSLTVKYGGGEEAYRVSDTVHSQEVVFCRGRGQDGGTLDAGAEVYELSCELWTQGAALVTVETNEYPDLEQDLEAEAEERCIQTVRVDLKLSKPDGGR